VLNGLGFSPKIVAGEFFDRDLADPHVRPETKPGRLGRYNVAHRLYPPIGYATPHSATVSTASLARFTAAAISEKSSATRILPRTRTRRPPCFRLIK